MLSTTLKCWIESAHDDKTETIACHTLLSLFLECRKSVNLQNITTSSDQTRCLLRTSCTDVDCCTTVDFIPRSFRTFFHIDPCTQELVIGIEKFYRNISLSTYKWGRLLFPEQCGKGHKNTGVHVTVCPSITLDFVEATPQNPLNGFCSNFVGICCSLLSHIGSYHITDHIGLSFWFDKFYRSYGTFAFYLFLWPEYLYLMSKTW